MNGRFALLICACCCVATWIAIKRENPSDPSLPADQIGAHMPTLYGDVDSNPSSLPVICMIKFRNETVTIRSAGQNRQFDVASSDGRLLASGLSEQEMAKLHTELFQSLETGFATTATGRPGQSFIWAGLDATAVPAAR